MAENLGPVTGGKKTFQIKDLDGDGRPERLEVTLAKDQTAPEGFRVTQWALRLSSGQELSALEAIQNSSRRFVGKGEAYRYAGIPDEQRGFDFFISPLSVRTLSTYGDSASIDLLAHAGEAPTIAVDCRPRSQVELSVSGAGQTLQQDINCHTGGVLTLPKYDQPTDWRVTVTAKAPGATPYAMHYRHYHEQGLDAFSGQVTSFEGHVTILGGQLLFSVGAGFDRSPFGPFHHGSSTLDIDHLAQRR